MIKLFKKLYSLAGDDQKKINISLLLKFVDSFLSFVPLGAALIFFEKYINDELTGSLPLLLLGVMVLGVVLRTFERYYMDLTQYSTSYRIFSNVRINVADHLKKINMGFYTDDNIGNVTTTLINGVAFIEEQGINGVMEALTSLANIVVIGIMLLTMDLGVGLIYIVTIVIIGLILVSYNKKTIAYANEHNRANESLTSAIIEYVKNISVIKAFHLLGKHERSNKAFIDRRKTDLQGEALNIPYICISMALMAVGASAIIWYILATKDGMPLYNVIIICIFTMYIFRSLEVFTLKIAIFNIAQDSLDSIDKLYDIEIQESVKTETPNGYDIEFKDVVFAYEEKPVINGISFKLKENTMNALVGLSGSGKSTLVNLIPRFFDPQSGSISIGGVDISDMSLETLYSSISMVFQNVYLFKDTIYNNIVFGNENATEEDVISACKKAKCYDFITNLADGFETLVGEAGLSLSGGERQRISIARAILKDSPIILLDEATASVDPDNEVDIQEAINALVENKTILVIAHKLSCVKNANQILVVDDGKLVQSGTHDELCQKDGLYKSLWEKRTNSKSWKISNS